MRGAALRGWRSFWRRRYRCFWGGPPATRTPRPIPRTHLLIVTGASGEPKLRAAVPCPRHGLRRRGHLAQFDIPDSQVIVPRRADHAGPARHQRSLDTREGVSQAFDRIAARASASGDAVLILLIGHGSSDGDVSRFNVPGTDMSDADFKAQLDKLSNQVVAFVNAASASGDFVKMLSGKNRVIVTATKSGFERNETLFAGTFRRAPMRRTVADADKDGRVSMLEAFVYARREVQREYETYESAADRTRHAR